MQTYISLLRGINVSGQKIIKMDALRSLYEKLGFKEVKSYLQSGNIVFKAEVTAPELLASRLQQAIQDTFGFDIPVLTLEALQLEKALKDNPFQQAEGFDIKHIYFSFLFQKASPDDQAFVEAKKSAVEQLAWGERLIFLCCPDGYGKTKLSNNFIEKKLKCMATTRNWNTVNELYNLATTI